LESQLIEVMIVKMPPIQFTGIVNLIQMKWMKVMNTRESMMSQEFQHCLESQLIEVMIGKCLRLNSPRRFCRSHGALSIPRSIDHDRVLFGDFPPHSAAILRDGWAAELRRAGAAAANTIASENLSFLCRAPLADTQTVESDVPRSLYRYGRFLSSKRLTRRPSYAYLSQFRR
jgi:hypothetical protein